MTYSKLLRKTRGPVGLIRVNGQTGKFTHLDKILFLGGPQSHPRVQFKQPRRKTTKVPLCKWY